MEDWKNEIIEKTKPSGIFLDIKDVKKALNMTNKDLAEMFGLKLSVYSNSSAKRRYEDAVVYLYNKMNNHKKETVKEQLESLVSQNTMMIGKCKTLEDYAELENVFVKNIMNILTPKITPNVKDENGVACDTLIG